MTNGWIGVDFDGTLATDIGSIPIPAMVNRVKRWLSLGIEVRIVTARVASNPVDEWDYLHIGKEKDFLNAWCLEHIGATLPITAQKDYRMYQLWDDRAVQVIKDTGERVGNVNRPSNKDIGTEIIDEEIGYIR
jgi:hypothetical protein